MQHKVRLVQLGCRFGSEPYLASLPAVTVDHKLEFFHREDPNHEGAPEASPPAVAAVKIFNLQYGIDLTLACIPGSKLIFEK